MKSKFFKIPFFVVATLFALGFLLRSVSQAETDVEMVPGEILVKFKSGADVRNIHAANGTRTLEVIPRINVHVVGLGPGVDPVAAAERFNRNPNVEYAEVNGLYYAIHASGAFVPTDEFYLDYQWNMDAIAAPLAWYITKGSNIVKIAILDTGIQSNHEDIYPKVVASKNFSKSRTLQDNYGHGTHVAGIAAARTNNLDGVAGAGYDCSLMNVKVLNDRGSGTWDGIAKGIIWAADNSAKVINMSLGGSSGSSTLENAVNYAWGKGVVIVAAAGNDGTTTPLYPAYYTNVIAVAATDFLDELAYFSTFGNWVDVAAPGDTIPSTYPLPYPYDYVYLSGTSMASPHVAGLACLLASQGRSRDNIRAAIENTTLYKGSYPIANGLINAHKAVDYTIIP